MCPRYRSVANLSGEPLLIRRTRITHLGVGAAVRVEVVPHPMESQIESGNRVQIFHYVERDARLAIGLSRN